MLGTSGNVNLGAVDMPVDPTLFGLTDSNKFRVEYSMSDFTKLDEIMGCKWDMKPHTEGDPYSFFKFVKFVVIHIDKSDVLKVKFTYAGSDFPVCDDYRERCTGSNAVHSSFLNVTTNDSVVSLS